MAYDRKSVKQKARLAMAQARPGMWVAALVLVALTVMLPTLVQMLIPGGLDWLRLSLATVEHPEMEDWLAVQALSALGAYVTFSLALGMVTALLRIVLVYGWRGYGLRIYRGEHSGVGCLFGGFPRLGTVLGSGVMVGIFWYLWEMLMVVISLGVMLVMAAFETYIPGPVRALTLILLVALNTVWALWVACRYTLTPYFVMSRPEMGALDAIAASKKAMKGNKLRRIVLSLSFLGWRLLVGLIALAVAGVGGLLALLSVTDRLFLLAERIAQGAADAEMIVDFFGAMVLPWLLVALVAGLVCLPLRLWLMSYKNVALAGFFQEIVGDAPAAAAPVFRSAPAATPPVTPPAGTPAVERTPAASGVTVGEKPYDPFGGTTSQPPRWEQ